MAPNSALTDLQAALAKETQARIAAEQKAQKAEAKVREVQDEIEDLSVTLFEEANEMVAKERREKAVLEERVKDLEGRERDRKRRLEMLEQALGRIERVRKLLDG